MLAFVVIVRTVFLLVYTVAISTGMKLYKIGELCRGAADNSQTIYVTAQGVVISFDGNAERPDPYTTYLNEIVGCTVIFRVNRTGFAGATTIIGVHFRPEFTVASAKRTLPVPSRRKRDNGCESAYFTIYDNLESFFLGPICSEDTPPSDFETIGSELYFRFLIDYTVPATLSEVIGETRTLVPPEVEEPAITSDTTTLTSKTETSSDPDTGAVSLDFLPRVFFNIEVTVFVQDCDKSKSPDLMKCSKSGRCLHNSTVCDDLGATNCRSVTSPNDVSDQNLGEPSNCGPNECLTGNGGCAHACTDTSNSFLCSCNTGYKLNADGRNCDVEETNSADLRQVEETNSADLRPVWVTIAILLVGLLTSGFYWIYILYIWPYMKEHDVLNRLAIYFNGIPARFVAFLLSIPGKLSALWTRTGALVVTACTYVTHSPTTAKNMNDVDVNDASVGENVNGTDVADVEMENGTGDAETTTVNIENSTETSTT